MDSSQFMKKCLNMLNSDNFIKLTDDPTKSIEGKIQRAIRKMKSKLIKDEYNNVYPTGSAPGKLFGTVKPHKMVKNDNIDNLPLRPTFQALVSILSFSETSGEVTITP